MRLSLLIGTALLAAASLAHADDKAGRRQQIKEAHAKALKACEGTPEAERRACVRREVCAQAQDPSACQERYAKRDKIREACKDKKGDEHRACIRAERGKT